MIRAAVFCLAALSCAVWAQAPDPDKEGCHQSKVVTRMPGCVIYDCKYADYAAADIPRRSGESGHMVEGQFENISMRCPAEKSALELGRNTEAALKNAGFKILYTEIYGSGVRFWMSAQKGPVWVYLAADSDNYDLTTVRQKEMEQVMTANAEGWAEQVNQTGRVSVYGINFDTAKATIRPDSEPALIEVLKLLAANPSWAMLVAGHTDNVGAKEMNLALSGQRAQAVIAWLTGRGVDKVRLAPAGFGDTRPLAENTNEEGWQKNRRVDLVKLY